ncbi:MAG: LuxR C-terminal-related transcriptional regulator, partial [Acidimicrobiales bacterium]
TQATLIVADDYPLYVEGLHRRVEADGRFRLAGTAGDGDEAVRLCIETRPDVALVGWFLAGQRGAALFELLQAASPTTQIVVLAGVVDAEVVHEAVALGARGFLVKQEAGPAVLDALYRVSLGLTAFSPAAEACLVDAVRARAEDAGAVPSPRETEILRLLAGGATSRQVADRMFVSEATVKSHLNRLYKKLGVNDRSAAVAVAMRRSWVA